MPRDDAAEFRRAVAEEGLTLNQAMLEAVEWWMENRMNRQHAERGSALRPR